MLVRQGTDIADAAALVGTTRARLGRLCESRAPFDDLLRLSPGRDAKTQLIKTEQILGQLVLGRCAEMAFEDIYRREMGTADIALVDLRESRSDTDYRLRNGLGRYLYRVNIKVHGSRFRQSVEMVGLDPDDCFPLATYKIHSALKKQEEEHLPYIFAVVSAPELNAATVGTLLPRDVLDAVALVRGSEITGKRYLEDRTIDLLVKTEADAFRITFERLTGAQWRILSARKADKLLRELLYDRVFALRIRGFAQKFRHAELDMHFSLSRDMTALSEFLRTLKSEGQTKLASLLERGTF